MERIPARLAPQISVKIWSPTITAWAAGTSASARASRNPLGLGFPAWRTKGTPRAAQKSGQRRLFRELETTKSVIPLCSSSAFQAKSAGEGADSS